jgi:hypothetical protein
MTHPPQLILGKEIIRCIKRALARVDSLKVSTRCGLSPNARQIRPIADCDMPQLAGQRSSRPVGGIGRRGLQRPHQHLFDLLVGDRAGRPGPGLIGQAFQPAGHKPRAPLGHRRPRDAQPGGDCLVAEAPGTGQHDPTPQRQRLTGGPPAWTSSRRGAGAGPDPHRHHDQHLRCLQGGDAGLGGRPPALCGQRLATPGLRAGAATGHLSPGRLHRRPATAAERSPTGHGGRSRCCPPPRSRSPAGRARATRSRSASPAGPRDR